MNKIFLLGAVAVVALASCGGNKTADAEAKDSVKVDTVAFEGVLPLADAAGDTVRLELYAADSTYSYHSSVDGKAVNGKYILTDSLLTTVGTASDTTFYKYTTDSLVLLGADKQPAASGLPYVLKAVKK